MSTQRPNQQRPAITSRLQSKLLEAGSLMSLGRYPLYPP
jgi:hypothetical protein